jgi:hypothetical protein
MTNAADQSSPNLYELTGKDTDVSYATSGIDGRPRFNMTDVGLSLSFSGDEIDVASTPLGTEVTVTTEAADDGRTVTFTLVVPEITLGTHDSAEFDSVAIETTTRPIDLTHGKLDHGPLQTYRVITLHGTANAVEF